ncbi:MAG: hypothetical protein ACJAXX_003019, partial [Roseivirga sp.]
MGGSRLRGNDGFFLGVYFLFRKSRIALLKSV